MELKDKLLYFIENYSNAFFVGSLITNKTTYLNQKAKDLFDMTAETCDFSKIFDRTETHISKIIQDSLQTDYACLLYNFVALKADGTKLMVDMQLGFFDENRTEVYLEIIPHNESVEKITRLQVTHSPRAEAILDFNEEFTLHHCNQNFYRLLDAKNHDALNKIHYNLSETLLSSTKSDLFHQIKEGLKESESFHTEIQFTTLEGIEKWISLEFQKRIFDDHVEKLWCFATNIDNKAKRRAELSLLNQYLSVVQKSTQDILYRVDVETNTMYHFTDLHHRIGEEKAIHDYPNVLMKENMVHPDDKEVYLRDLDDFYKLDKLSQHPIRFALEPGKYQWYKISRKKIFDDEENLKEVFVMLKNIQEEQKMKKKVSSLNNHFETLQSISGESFYIIDIKKKILKQKGQVAEELGLFSDLPGYPESFFPKIYPKDLQRFSDFTHESMDGNTGSTQVRIQNIYGDYQWYDILSGIIRDDDGKLSEVVGKISNIHKEKSLVKDDAMATQHYYAVQSLIDQCFFSVNTNTKVLLTNGKIPDEIGLPPRLEGYPQSALPYIFPDHVPLFKKFVTKALTTNDNKIDIKLKNTDNSYQWYEIITKNIRNQGDKVVEVIGTITNVQHKYQ